MASHDEMTERARPRWWILATLGVALSGCPDTVDPGATSADTEQTSGIDLDGGSTTSNESNASADNGTADGSATQGSATSTDGGNTDSADSGSDGGTATTTGGNPGGTVDCGGTVWACGNGLDDDGDGFIDLFDPECTGPCDDDEGSFQTGIPGDNMDCKQDCFFDGNSGQGDDGCIWDLRCDPANPGADINCEYTGGNNCNNQPPNQEQGCLDFCEPFVPPGCDCFGCCEVQTDEGSVWIFLNSSPDCALDNLDACSECTPQIEDCGNPCVPEECEICFGETEPPEGCGGVSCPAGDPCMSNADCPTDYFCYLSCCYPPPPG